MIPARLVALGLGLALLASAHRASSQAPTSEPDAADPERLFERATDAIGEGDIAGAAELLELAAAQTSQPSVAAESLFLLGELYEDELDRPREAAAAYKRITVEFSASRVSIAAAKRLEVLEEMLGDEHGDAARLSRFLAIRREDTERPAAESLALAEALLAEDPQWITAARVRLWMAGVALRDGQLERAERLYREALSSGDANVVFEARLAASALAKDRGAYDEAKEIARAIDPGGVPGRLEARRDALLAIERAQRRAGRAVYAIAALLGIPILFLALIGWRKRSLRGVAAALWPPPTETIYLVGVLGVFVGAAFTGHLGIAKAVVLVSVAGLVVSWIAGAAHRALPRSWPLSIGVGLGAALAVACAFYIALVRGGLVDIIITTVRFGPDL